MCVCLSACLSVSVCMSVCVCLCVSVSIYLWGYTISPYFFEFCPLPLTLLSFFSSVFKFSYIFLLQYSLNILFHFTVNYIFLRLNVSNITSRHVQSLILSSEFFLNAYKRFLILYFCNVAYKSFGLRGSSVAAKLLTNISAHSVTC